MVWRGSRLDVDLANALAGYKEFADYLDDPAMPQPLYEVSMEKMRVSTRKYAKRQVSWITGKLLPVCSETEDAEIVVLDAGGTPTSQTFGFY